MQPTLSAETLAARKFFAAALLALLAATVLGACAAPLPSRGTDVRAAPASGFKAPPATSDLERDVRVAGRQATYGLHLAPLPNLLYHLDCVSGAVFCAQAPFRELWAAIGLDADDEAALASWKALRRRYDGELRPVGGRSGSLPLLAGAGSFQLAERQRVAGLLARTPATYEASMALLSTPSDAHELGLSAAIFVPPAGVASAALLDALAAPPAHRAALTTLARRACGFVYALPRTPKSYAFLFAAPDAAAAGELVERFIVLDAVREGALVELVGGRE